MDEKKSCEFEMIMAGSNDNATNKIRACLEGHRVHPGEDLR